MDENEPSHRVTLSSMYEKLESVDDNVKVLLERESTLNLAPRVARLEKIVYWIGLPIAALGTGQALGIDTLISQLF